MRYFQRFRKKLEEFRVSKKFSPLKISSCCTVYIRTHFLFPYVSTSSNAFQNKSEGYCNKNFYCYVASKLDGFFLRLVNKKIEKLLLWNIQAMRFLNKHQLGPKLLCTFNNGLVMEYIHGETVSWTNFKRIKDDEVWR